MYGDQWVRCRQRKKLVDVAAINPARKIMEPSSLRRAAAASVMGSVPVEAAHRSRGLTLQLARDIRPNAGSRNAGCFADLERFDFACGNQLIALGDPDTYCGEGLPWR